MSITVSSPDPGGLTLIPSTGLWHPAWCDQLADCEHGHTSPMVHGNTKRTHGDRPEMRWSLQVSEHDDSSRGAYVWGMITVANNLVTEQKTAVVMCDPIEAFKLGHDLIRASGFAYGEGLPAPAAPEILPSRPKLEVVR